MVPTEEVERQLRGLGLLASALLFLPLFTEAWGRGFPKPLSEHFWFQAEFLKQNYLNRK
jgi:hypothetical protein